MMTFSLKFLSAMVVASLFLFAGAGDFVQAKKPAQPGPEQASPAQAGPAQPAQKHDATTSGPVPDASTCYPLMGLCFSNKVDSALIGTIAITGLTILYNLRRERKKENEARKRYLLALKEEIELNIQGLSKTVQSWPPRNEICGFLRTSAQHRPIINFSYSSVIFKNRTEVLQDLPDMLINNIVAFYGGLDGLTGDIASVEGKAFETISPEGRENIILDILETQKLTQQQGESLLTAIKLHLRDKVGLLTN